MADNAEHLGKVSFSDFLLGSELLMKTSLIQTTFKLLPPDGKSPCHHRVPKLKIFLIFIEPNSIAVSQTPMLIILLKWSQHLKTEFKTKPNDVCWHLLVLLVFLFLLTFIVSVFKAYQNMIFEQFGRNAFIENSFCKNLKYRLHDEGFSSLKVIRASLGQYWLFDHSWFREEFLLWYYYILHHKARYFYRPSKFKTSGKLIQLHQTD